MVPENSGFPGWSCCVSCWLLLAIFAVSCCTKAFALATSVSSSSIRPWPVTDWVCKLADVLNDFWTKGAPSSQINAYAHSAHSLLGSVSNHDLLGDVSDVPNFLSSFQICVGEILIRMGGSPLDRASSVPVSDQSAGQRPLDGPQWQGFPVPEWVHVYSVYSSSRKSFWDYRKSNRPQW